MRINRFLGSICRITGIIFLVLAAALTAGCSKQGGEAPGGKASRPNVIIITMDTTRADYLGCYGSQTKTPAIDAFAKDAVLFSNCYSTTNSTNPSHAAIFTSLYMRDHGVLGNNYMLADYPGFMPKLFKEAGYTTAAFTSGGHLDKTVNVNQGFDEFTCPQQNYETIAGGTTGLVLGWLDEYNKKAAGKKAAPFMLWVHYFDPHFKYIPPAPFDTMYKDTSGDRIDWEKEYNLKDEANRRYMSASKDPAHYRNLYGGEVSYMDEQMGRLLARLKETGLYDNSIIVVMADHGESLGEHGIYWDHRGLYDSTIRIPMLIKPASGGKPGVRDQLVSSVDVYPTVFEMCGIKLKNPVMGTSLVGVINNPSYPDPRKEVYFQSIMEEYIGIRTNEYTYIRRVKGSDGYDPRADSYGQAGLVELYDNIKDRDQKFNMAEKNPELLDQFQRMAGLFITDRKLSVKPQVVDNKEHLGKLKALGYVQ